MGVSQERAESLLNRYEWDDLKLRDALERNRAAVLTEAGMAPDPAPAAAPTVVVSTVESKRMTEEPKDKAGNSVVSTDREEGAGAAGADKTREKGPVGDAKGDVKDSGKVECATSEDPDLLGTDTIAPCVGPTEPGLVPVLPPLESAIETHCTICGEEMKHLLSYEAGVYVYANPIHRHVILYHYTHTHNPCVSPPYTSVLREAHAGQHEGGLPSELCGEKYVQCIGGLWRAIALHH